MASITPVTLEPREHGHLPLLPLVGLTGDSGLCTLEGDSRCPDHSSAVQAVVWASGGADFPRQWEEKRWQRAQLVQVFGGPMDEHLALWSTGRTRGIGWPPFPLEGITQPSRLVGAFQ